MTDSGFIVPNEADAGYSDQAEMDAQDWRMLAGIGQGTGVISGCIVTAQGSPDATVAVSGGSYAIRGIPVTCAGGNVNVLSGSANADGSTSLAADANYYRYDAIVGNISGQLGVLHGTAPSPTYPDYVVNPVFPTVDRTLYAPMAALYIPPTAAGLTGVQAAMITRKDVDVSAGAYVAPYFKYSVPTNGIAETRNRISAMSNQAAIIQTGVLYLCAIYVPRSIVTNIVFVSGNTAASSPTHWWFALYNSSRTLLRQTADQTSTAWGSNTVMSKALTSPYTITDAGMYYVGIMMTATTVVSLLGNSRGGANDAASFAPVLYGISDTGLTTTAPSTAAAITFSTVGAPYAYLT